MKDEDFKLLRGFEDRQMIERTLVNVELLSRLTEKMTKLSGFRRQEEVPGGCRRGEGDTRRFQISYLGYTNTFRQFLMKNNWTSRNR